MLSPGSYTHKTSEWAHSSHRCTSMDLLPFIKKTIGDHIRHDYLKRDIGEMKIVCVCVCVRACNLSLSNSAWVDMQSEYSLKWSYEFLKDSCLSFSPVTHLALSLTTSATVTTTTMQSPCCSGWTQESAFTPPFHNTHQQVLAIPPSTYVSIPSSLSSSTGMAIIQATVIPHLDQDLPSHLHTGVL